jgi:hypothetical protein
MVSDSAKPRAIAGYVMAMWTGMLEGPGGLPRFFLSVGGALRALEQYPSWGRGAVTVYECTRQGRTYRIGRAVTSGAGA